MNLMRYKNGLIVLTSFVISLFVGAGIVALYGANPIVAAHEMLNGALGDWQAALSLLARAVPLVLLTTATSVAFYAGVSNIGCEGQLYTGAFAAAWVGLTFPNLPGWVLIPMGLLAAIGISCMWGLAPMKASLDRGINLVVLTIMLNSVGTLATAALAVGPFADKTTAAGATARIPEAMRLSRFVPTSTFNSGVWLALVVFCAVAFIMMFTVLGYEWRCCRMNLRFARYGGVNFRRVQLWSMAISAGMAGLGGSLLVMGDQGRFRIGISPGHAWTGMILSMMVAYHPIGGLIASLIYALMDAGAIQMELVTGVPVEIVQIVICTAVLFVTAGIALANRAGNRIREE